MKKILVHIRTGIKFFIILVLSVVLIIAGITLLYRPTYSVTLNGEFVRIYK